MEKKNYYAILGISPAESGEGVVASVPCVLTVGEEGLSGRKPRFVSVCLKTLKMARVCKCVSSPGAARKKGSCFVF